MDANQANDIVTYGFYAMITGIAGFIAQSISRIKDSIESLNSHVAVLLERTDRHDRDLERLEDKLNKFDEQCDQKHERKGR